MSERDTQALFSQEALDRLSVDKNNEIGDRAARLGGVVQRNLVNARKNPEMWVPTRTDPFDGTHTSFTPEYRLGVRHGAYLQFGVSPKYEELRGTPEWLSDIDNMLIGFRQYKRDLPAGTIVGYTDGATSGPFDETFFYLEPAPEFEAEEDVDHRVVCYEHGTRVDPKDTETVIGILTLLAEQTSGTQPGSTPV